MSFLKLLGLFAIVFVIFWVVSVILGGDALNGKIENGHYYLGSHGKYTEVSRAIYVASASFMMILFGVWALPLFILFLSCCKPPWRGEGIEDWIFTLVIGALSAGSFAAIVISLRCILRAFGII